MTKDGVRDFIAAEYTLSENYVHGLAAFGPRLKTFESPHSSRGSSPGLPAGNSVKGAGHADDPWFQLQAIARVVNWLKLKLGGEKARESK